MSRRNRRHRGEKPKASVDMTSLIDLTFLLLVTFIVTLPALEQGVSIMLPEAKTDELPRPEEKPRIITIDSRNQIFLGDKPMASVAQLEEVFKEIAAQVPDPKNRPPVLVRADERLDYGSVMNVVKLLHKYKMVKMSLVTVQK